MDKSNWRIAIAEKESDIKRNTVAYGYYHDENAPTFSDNPFRLYKKSDKEYGVEMPSHYKTQYNKDTKKVEVVYEKGEDGKERPVKETECQPTSKEAYAEILNTLKEAYECKSKDHQQAKKNDHER